MFLILEKNILNVEKYRAEESIREGNSKSEVIIDALDLLDESLSIY